MSALPPPPNSTGRELSLGITNVMFTVMLWTQLVIVVNGGGRGKS